MEGRGNTQEVHGIVGEMKRKYMEAWGTAQEVHGRMGKLKVGRGPGYAPCLLSNDFQFHKFCRILFVCLFCYACMSSVWFVGIAGTKILPFRKVDLFHKNPCCTHFPEDRKCAELFPWVCLEVHQI